MTREQVKSASWTTIKGLFTVIGGLVVAAGFLLNVLGWRFTGTADDIRLNSARITSLEEWRKVAEPQGKATMFMLCPIYKQSFPGAPVPPECP
jgi:hypothetical protein